MKVRYVQFVILFINFTIVALCINFNTNILLPMTENSTIYPEIPTYDWDLYTKGLMMSSQNWGEAITQFITGLIIQKCGSKPVITFSLFGIGILILLQPIAVFHFESTAMFVFNPVIGILHGCFIPSMHNLLGKWTPLDERNRALNYVFSGYYVATIVVGPLVGLVSASKFGWPAVYYFVGTLAILASILSFLCLANSPTQHKSISEDERKYILISLNQEEHTKKQKTPWKAILTSFPVWAIIFAQIGVLGGYSVISYLGPTYFNKGLGINIEHSNTLSALPYIISLTTMLLTSNICDAVVNKSILSLTAVRKICNTIGTFLVAFFLVILTMIPTEYTKLCFITMMLIFGLDGVNCSGYYINDNDLSPKYAGVITSVARSISNIVVLIVPIVMGMVLTDPTDVGSWKIVFISGAVLYTVGNIVYLIWGTAEVQPWDDYEKYNKKDSPVEMKLLNNEVKTSLA